jgi:DNA topoisomerase I
MPRDTQLIICEKPSAALKVAQALADKTPKKNTYMRKIPYYELTHNGKKITVVSAVGHLYTVTEKNKKGWTYPIFEIEWKASAEVNKASSYTKQYLNLIKKVAKEANDIIVACDYDVEGEVIGYNIVRFACKKKDAKRMKFSTTTKEDLRQSYEEVIDHLDLGQAEAGITRHELDWLFGINLSRALTLSIKRATGRFKILSSGRVQGPALKILTEKEKEIKAFVPEPYWELELFSKELNSLHETGRFLKKEEVETIHKKCKGHKATVSQVKSRKFKQAQPTPFDLTAMQIESYKVLGIAPKKTLELAQSLYTNSYISYPRTSSNQLPESIGYKKILTKLSKQPKYKKLTLQLMKGPLKPNNGKKKDPAHPAIYPTGEIPRKLDEREAKLYDLIVKRFMATFAKPAIRETVNVKIDVNQENFVTKGSRTIEKNWHEYYEPYVKLQEEEITVKENQELNIKDLKIHDKETSPPKRYTPASIIKELEKRNLGTKATRSDIIESLYNRSYLKRGKSIEVTELGISTTKILDKYCPDILDEKLTRDFEDDMNKIREGKSSEEKVIKEAEKFLTKILKQFKAKEEIIGKGLLGSYETTLKEESYVMKCDTCEPGNLSIRYSPRFKSYFIGCTNYPNCKRIYSLPRGYLAKTTAKKCKHCEFPEVNLISKGKRPWVFCINPDCSSKDEYKKKVAARVQANKDST